MFKFFLGHAKMALYISRRYKILYDSNCVVELCFKRLINARVIHYFIFYPSMKKVGQFEDIWSVQNLLCRVENGVLSFAEIMG